MNQIVLEGTVPESFQNQNEFYLKIADKDLANAVAFFNGTRTTFRAGSVAVRKKDIVQNCKAGDYIQLRLCTEQRSDGIRVRAIDFKKLKSA
jgi:hypothetical protein